jgi:hypothetical protein
MITRKSITKSEGKANRNPGSPVAVTASVTISSALGIFSQSGALASDNVVGNNGPNVPKRERAVSVCWENDTVSRNGQVLHRWRLIGGVPHGSPSWMDPFANWLPWSEGRRTVLYDVAQGMFTPADKDLSPPDRDDRPYAGILAFGLTLHVEKDRSYHGLKFVTGVVGPWSLAEETQNAVHGLIGNDKSEGWYYQLENEPIFNFAYEYRHKFRQSRSPGSGYFAKAG